MAIFVVSKSKAYFLNIVFATCIGIWFDIEYLVLSIIQCHMKAGVDIGFYSKNILTNIV